MPGSIGAAVAAAVTSANSKVQLFNSSDKRPTVSSAMRWAKKHLEKSNTGGFYLTGVIQLLIDDATVDLSPHILVDPARTSDASYVREVLSSMTAEQIEKYGSNEVNSAVKLMKSVIANIADYKMDEYIHQPRPADGANRAMHTVGKHMRLKIKQGHPCTRRGVTCYHLTTGPASGAFRTHTERSDLPTHRYLLAAMPPQTHVTSRNSCPQNDLEVR